MKVTVTISFFEEEAAVEIRSGLFMHKKSIVVGRKALRQDGIQRSRKTDYFTGFKKIIHIIERASSLKPFVEVKKAEIREKNVFTGEAYLWYYSFVYPIMPMVFVCKVPELEHCVIAKIELNVDTIKGGIQLWKILRKF